MSIGDLEHLSVQDKRRLLARRLLDAGIAPVQRFPLSFSQQRLWFLEQLEPGGAAYNVPAAVRLDGPINLEVWQRCVDEIVRRHASLRTTFTQDAGRPLQEVSATGKADFAVIDGSHLNGEDELRARLGQEAARPFDLARGPLIRVRFFRLAPQRHVLLLTMHHIAADLWSMAVAVRELVTLYRAFQAGQSSPLPALPIQYTDYALWQQNRTDQGIPHWKEVLQGAEPALDLPTDRPRPTVQTSRGGSRPFALPAPLSNRLRSLSQAEGVTPFMTLLAAFAVLLHRYSGQSDLVIGSPVANRTRPETEQLIGFFVNTLALRLDLSGDLTFRELLGRVRKVCLDAYAHQEVPFERLVEELHPQRDLSRSPIFQVSFVFQNIAMPELEIDGLRVIPMTLSSTTARFDLELQLFDRPDGMVGWFEYNADLFDAATIGHLSTALGRLTEQIADAPDRPLAGLALLGEEEQRALATGPNATARIWPENAWAHREFETQARRTPHSEALVCADETLSYAELELRANQLAHHLRGHGIGPGDLVGICTGRTPDLLVALLGTLKAGAAYVPLDPLYPPERIAFMVQDSGLRLLLGHSSLASALPATTGPVIWLDQVSDALATEPGTAPDVTVAGDDLAYVIYTSGSTGTPKGVRIPHRALSNFLQSLRERPGIEPADTLMAVTTFCFDIAMLELLLPLTTGARVALVNREVAADGARLARELATSGATLMQATPSTWRMLRASGWRPASPDFRMLCGGEALPADLAADLLSTGAPLWNMYGPTETTIWSAVTRVTGPEIRLGKPIANTELHVLDSAGALLPPGVPGELHIGGAGLAHGYLDRPELTAERFVRHPFPIGLGDRLYRTGDLVRRLADGGLEFLGRIDHQVKLRGHRIELGEVETVLAQHPAIRQAVVTVREDVPGDQRLIAYLVADATSAAEVAGQAPDEELDRWRSVWDSAYDEPGAPGVTVADPTFDISGWTDSYTGGPIPAEQMREWVDRTAQRILGRAPQSVLDVGCGTGLILHAVAPSCERYWGTDFSRVALNRLQSSVEGRFTGDVRLYECAADGLDRLPPQKFDVVVMNSVVQYFPDEEYLARVIAGALERLQPGGAVIVGDVRSLPLLEAFHASIENRQSDGLAERVRRRVAEDEELVIDPHFFLALAQRLEGVAEVQIHPRRGRAANEMTRFRYDVMMTSGAPQGEPVADPPLGCGPGELRERVSRGDDVVIARDVPNSRIGEGASAIDPEDVYELAEEHGYRADLDWSQHGPDGAFDVVLRRLGPDGVPLAPAPAVASPVLDGPLSSWVNGAAARLTRRLQPELRARLGRSLPDYMVPSAFVFLDALPLTPNDKVDRKALPAPGSPRPDVRHSYQAPRTELEKTLAGIWEGLLQVSAVSMDDDFFDLGGHSLLATQIVSRTRTATNLDISLRDLFEHPTVARLAGWLERAGPRVAEPMPLVDRTQNQPLSPAQEWLCLDHPLALDDPAHTVVTVARLRGALDEDALDQALQYLVRRHETLRTRLVAGPSGLMQVIDQEGEWPLERIRLRALADQETVTNQILARESTRRFVPSQGPMARACLITVTGTERVLVLAIHHAVTDNWSYGVLLRDLSLAYEACAGGREPVLPALERQFADVAAWQRGRSDDDHLAYWRALLTDLPPAPDLRSDDPVDGGGSARTFELSPALTASARRLAHDQGATLFMVLLAAFGALLAAHTDRRVLAVDFPVSGRDRPETEPLIGFFVNPLVLRADLRSDPSFAELLTRIRHSTLEAYAHQETPVHALRRELAGTSEPVRLGFNLLNAALPEVALGDVRLEPMSDDWGFLHIPPGQEPGLTDLSLIMTEDGDRVRGTWMHTAGRVGEALADRLARRWSRLLQIVVDEPAVRIEELGERLAKEEDH